MNNLSSIDQAEIKKFSELAENWWDKEGEFKMLHLINPLRLTYIINKINVHYGHLLLPERQMLEIIDVGCGGGILSSSLALEGYKSVSGIDASPENIEIAKNTSQNTQQLAINYSCTSVEELLKEDKQYDLVICLEVIEHVANVDHFLNCLASIVRSGGILIISTINRNIKSYLQAIIMAEYVLGWVPRRTHDHSKFLQPSEIKKMMPPSLILQELKGLTYDLSSNEWQLTEDISVNYFAFFTKS